MDVNEPAAWTAAAVVVAAMCVSASPAGAQSTPAAQTYGAFADLGHLFAPNEPHNDLFRSRGTTWHVNQTVVNMAGVFSSLIGYDSLYSKDNINYTRPWGADFTPYLMLGANVSYPITAKLNGTAFVVNGYWHLARANSVPSAGGQLAYALTPEITIRETVLFGPHQPDTSLGRWRVLSDSIIERKAGRLTMAFNGHVATEAADDRRAWWVAAQLPLQWHLGGPWRVALRPEYAWDSSGRWTLAEQTVAALTATVEHRATVRSVGTSLKLEYRVDRSTGPLGGFFTDREGGLTPTQHLFIVGAVLRLDGSR